MGQAFKGDLGSGNLILPDCCSCVHEPHSCWRGRERERESGTRERKGEDRGGRGAGGGARGVLSN